MAFCQWCSDNFRVPCRWLFSLVQAGVAIAIICIIYFHLTDFDYDVTVGDLNVRVENVTCLLGQDSSGKDLCIYGYITCGVSLLISLLLLIMVLFTCVCAVRSSPVVTLVLTTLGTVWWVAAGLVVTTFNARAIEEGTPQQRWRTVVNILTWVNALLYAIQAVSSVCWLCYAACGCCGGREVAERRRAEREAARAQAKAQALEQQLAQSMQATPAGAGAAAAAAAGDVEKGQASAPCCFSMNRP